MGAARLAPLPTWAASAGLMIGAMACGDGPTDPPPPPVPSLEVVSVQNQRVAVGSEVILRPSVRLTDPDGSPMAGVSVTFQVTVGGGVLSGAAGLTDSEGTFEVAGWTLGPAPGVNQVLARVDDFPLIPPVTVSAEAVAKGGYQIDLRFLSPELGQNELVVREAAARWEALLVGDLPDMDFRAQPFPAKGCFGRDHPAVQEVVDDVLVWVLLEEIDGPGGVIAQAGPCSALREPGFLPAIGIVILDAADTDSGDAFGQLDDVVLHELGHAIGFIEGIWEALGLLLDPSEGFPSGSRDTRFAGAHARAAYAQVGGTSPTGDVPVHNTGGNGSRDSHWRESILDAELMTPFIEFGPTSENPLSLVTLGAMADLGFVVDVGEVDDFQVGAALLARASSAEPPSHLPSFQEVVLQPEILRR